MNGFAAELIAVVDELAFDYLDAPMVRIAAADVPVPMSEALESKAIPSVADIIAGVKNIL